MHKKHPNKPIIKSNLADIEHQKINSSKLTLKSKNSKSIDSDDLHKKFLRNLSSHQNNNSKNINNLTEYEVIARKKALNIFNSNKITVASVTADDLFVEANHNKEDAINTDNIVSNDVGQEDQNEYKNDNLITEKTIVSEQRNNDITKDTNNHNSDSGIIDSVNDKIYSSNNNYKDDVKTTNNTKKNTKKSIKKRKHGTELFINDRFNNDDDFDKKTISPYNKKQTFKVNKYKKKNNFKSNKSDLCIDVVEKITVKDLASCFAITLKDLHKFFASLDEKLTNDSIVPEYLISLLADDLGKKFQTIKKETEWQKFINMRVKSLGDLKARSPIVTVMGHVDHGKTTLLDSLRGTQVVEDESGGITQHIGSYQVKCDKNSSITFVDTPGHQAFTSMRVRGAQITDIVVLVVAADDGIKEQTIEAINHAKSASVPIVVAINKIDKKSIHIEKVLSELSLHDVVVEKYGGDVLSVEISARNNINLDLLQDAIILQSEMLGLEAYYKGFAKSVILESKIKTGLGIVATVIVMEGCLKVGDNFIVGKDKFGKIRNIVDCTGKKIKKAFPSQPVEISGFDSIPSPGDTMFVCSNEKQVKNILLDNKHDDNTKNVLKENHNVTLDDLFVTKSKKKKDINLVIKADTIGSLEAICESIKKISNDNVDTVNVNIIHKGIGIIGKCDIDLAKVTDSIIVAFRVKIDKISIKNDVKIVEHDIIYDTAQYIENIITNKNNVSEQDTIVGLVEVREVFDIDKLGRVAGSFVREGIIKVSNMVHVYYNEKFLFECKIVAIQRFKDSVKEVKSGYECGILVDKNQEIKNGCILKVIGKNI